MGIDEGTGGREGGTVSEGYGFLVFFFRGGRRAGAARVLGGDHAGFSVGSHAQADELGDEPTDEQVEYADRAAPGDARDLGGSGLVVVVARRARAAPREDLVSAEVLSAAMVASVEGEGEDADARERRAREKRGARGDGGVKSLARPGGGVGVLGEGGVRVSSPAFSRGDGGEVDEGGDDDDARVRSRAWN